MTPSSLDDRLERLPDPAARVVRAAGRVAHRLSVRGALVGGSVRDLWLGRAVDEVDLVVEDDPARFASALAAEIGGRPGARSPLSTAKVFTTGLPPVDIAAARRETYPRPGALPIIRPATIEEDLGRRDFSVNAMAIPLGADRPGDLLDPFDGAADLPSGLLRILHDRSFLDDPTRGFRAVRLGARLGFQLEPASRALLEAALESGAMTTVSPHRRRRELVAAANELPFERAARALSDPPLLRSLHPSLMPGNATLQLLARLDEAMAPPGPSGVRFAEGDSAREASPDRLLLLVGALLLGAGARDLDAAAEAMGIVGKGRVLLRRLTGSSVPLAAALAAASRPSGIAAAAAGASPEELLMAAAVDPASAPAIAAWKEIAGRQSLLTGEDLAGLGVPPGPRRGAILDRVREAVQDGLAPTREEQLDLARSLAGRPES